MHKGIEDITDVSKHSIVEDCEALSEELHSIRGKRKFGLYHFSNESYFSKTLEKLETSTTKSDFIRVGILTGESHFLSSLPELKNHVDIVILNDINEQLREHTRFLYECLLTAESIDEFTELYKDTKKNPLVDHISVDDLWKMMNTCRFTTTLGKKHFLNSNERFIACKKAMKNLVFCWSNVSLFDEKEHNRLKAIIKKHNAVITLINVSNLHHYDHVNLKNTVHSLSNGIKNPIILYSIGDNGKFEKNNLFSKVSFGVENYFNLLKSMHEAKEIPEISQTTASQIRKCVNHFNSHIIPEVIKDCFYDLSLLPKMSYGEGSLILAMPKISKKAPKSLLEICHKIAGMVLPWYRDYIEPDFLVKMSNKVIIVKKDAFKKMVELYQEKEIADIHQPEKSPDVTEHSIQYSSVKYGHWSLVSFLPPKMVSLEEIQQLVDKFTSGEQSITLIELILDKIAVYKKSPDPEKIEDILELEEVILSEKDRVLQNSQASYAYQDL